MKHSIAGGDHGLRRRELEAGQSALVRRFADVRDLGDATLEQLSECEAAMSPESYRCCRHVISENLRVLRAAEAMRDGDPKGLGRMMTAAHASERDDFECSVQEIDSLVDTAVNAIGCYGSRLTGGGFGGCTVSLVETTHVAAFQEVLLHTYLDPFGFEAEMFVCQAVDGAVARNSSSRSVERQQAAQ